MDSPNLPRTPVAAKQPGDLPGAGPSLAPSMTPSIAAAWGEIDEALTPIIGQQGVAALYRRSLHLTARAHPWLGAVLDNGAANAVGTGIDSVVDIDVLYGVLMRQDATVAGTVGEEFLRTFYGLLTNLIGASLTERLLHSVWANFLSDTRQQDISP